MDFLRRYGFGGVLADDMGLGKTVQVLAYLARELAEKRLAQPALVVCPTSVAPNWLSEAHRFTPDLKVELLGRGDRSDALATLPSQNLVITSYALLLRDIEVLAAQSWSMVVFDEAQWLKNRTSQSYRSAMRIKAGLRLCLTGTPVENHLGELKAQFDLAFPGLLGDDRHFLQRFRQPIEKSHDPQVARRLRQRLRPFLLRRTKQEVATELPPRTAHRGRHRAGRGAARPLRGHPHPDGEAGARRAGAARPRALAHHRARRPAQAAPGLLRPAPGRPAERAQGQGLGQARGADGPPADADRGRALGAAVLAVHHACWT